MKVVGVNLNSHFFMHAFYIIQDQRKELDVYYIPFGNDNAILKGVELLLEKEKQHSFTSVIMSK